MIIDSKIKDGQHKLSGVGYYAEEHQNGIVDITLWEIDGKTYGSYCEKPKEGDEDYVSELWLMEFPNCMCQVKFEPINVLLERRMHDNTKTLSVSDSSTYKTLLVLEDVIENNIAIAKNYITRPFACSAVEKMFVHD